MADDFDKAKMVALYEAHNADKVGEVDGLLEKYKASRALMWQKLAQKYGQSAIDNAEAKAGRRVGSAPAEPPEESSLSRSQASDASSAMAAFKKDFDSTLKEVAAAPSPSGPVAKPQDTAAFNRLKMIALYEAHNPEKAGEVDKLLSKYEGKHTLMWGKLAEKYGQDAIEAAEAAAAQATTSASPTSTARPPEPIEEGTSLVENGSKLSENLEANVEGDTTGVSSTATSDAKEGQANGAEAAVQDNTTPTVDSEPKSEANEGADVSSAPKMAFEATTDDEAPNMTDFDRLKLIALYEVHNADKVNEVDILLNKYGSMRTKMWEKLTQKYGIEAIENAEKAASAATVGVEKSNEDAVQEGAPNGGEKDRSSLREESGAMEEAVVDDGCNQAVAQGGSKVYEVVEMAPSSSMKLELDNAEERQAQEEHSTEEALLETLHKDDTLETAEATGAKEELVEVLQRDGQVEHEALMKIDDSNSIGAPPDSSKIILTGSDVPQDANIEDPAKTSADDIPDSDVVDTADENLAIANDAEIVDTTGTDLAIAADTAAVGATDGHEADSATANGTQPAENTAVVHPANVDLIDSTAVDAIRESDTLEDDSTNAGAINDTTSDVVAVAHSAVVVDVKADAAEDASSIGRPSRAQVIEAFESVCSQALQLNSKAFVSLTKMLWAEANEVNETNYAIPGPRDLNTAFTLAVDESGTMDVAEYERLWALMRTKNGAAVRGLAGGLLTTLGVGRGRAKQERDAKRTAFEAAVRAARLVAAPVVEDVHRSNDISTSGNDSGTLDSTGSDSPASKTLAESTPHIESTEVTPGMGEAEASKLNETNGDENPNNGETWVPKKQTAVPKKQNPKVRLTATQRVLTQRATAVRQFSELATDGSGSVSLEQVEAGCALLKLPEADARRLFAQLDPHPDDMNCVYVGQFLDLWRQRAHVYFPVPISGRTTSRSRDAAIDEIPSEASGTAPPDRFRSDLEMQFQRSKGARAGFEAENSRAKADWLARQRRQQNSQSRVAARVNPSLSPVSEVETALVGAAQLGHSGLHIEEVGAAAVAANAWRPASSPRPLNLASSTRVTRAAGRPSSAAAAPPFATTRATGGAPLGNAWMLAANGLRASNGVVGGESCEGSNIPEHAGMSASAPRPGNASLVMVSEARARVEAIRAKRLERERLSGLYTRLGTEI